MKQELNTINILRISCDHCVRSAEKQLIVMTLFISKYEQRTVKIKEGHFHNRATHTYTVEMNPVILPKCTVGSYNIFFYIIWCYILFELT
jgi:hypothetical protein